jgi:hypothetical protein
VTAPISTRPESTNWRELYRAAILELDESKISQQFVEAQKAVIERVKELFQEDGESSGEKQALDDAMYFLQALRSTLRFNTSASHNLGNDEDMKVA